MRLDQYLFQNNLAESRERARSLIMAGVVYMNGEKAEKAGINVKDDADIEVRGEDHPYVSRGGLKLEKAIEVFDVSVLDRVCMDVGASTGGFTDCLLQNGARKVYSVDVGYGQLAWKLRCDDRVVVLERTNIRKLDPKKIVEPIELFTIDVAFISLKLVFPALSGIVAENCEGVCLVKPQFEAGKDRVGKKGVVRDKETHIEVIQNAAENANQNGYSILNIDYSPITGPEGNIEFLMYVRKEHNPVPISDRLAENVVEQAHQSMRRS